MDPLEVDTIEGYKVDFMFLLQEMDYSLIRLIYKALSEEGSFLINFIINFLDRLKFRFLNMIRQPFLFYLFNSAILRLNCHIRHPIVEFRRLQHCVQQLMFSNTVFSS